METMAELQHHDRGKIDDCRTYLPSHVCVYVFENNIQPTD